MRVDIALITKGSDAYVLTTSGSRESKPGCNSFERHLKNQRKRNYNKKNITKKNGEKRWKQKRMNQT